MAIVCVRLKYTSFREGGVVPGVAEKKIYYLILFFIFPGLLPSQY
jgi:hypothetical protein